MTRKLMFALSLFGLALAGCSDDAEKKCNEFTEAFCQRVADCTSGTSSPTTKEACKSELKKEADCSNAIDAPGDFDKCVPAVKALACTKLEEIPDSCNISLSE